MGRFFGFLDGKEVFNGARFPRREGREMRGVRHIRYDECSSNSQYSKAMHHRILPPATPEMHLSIQ